MIKKHYYALGILLAMAFIIACTGNRSGDDTANKEDIPKKEYPKIDLYKGKYESLVVKGNDTAFKAFKNRYTASQQHLILALNRVDFSNFKNVDSLVVPDSLWTEMNSYSPFPVKLKQLEEVDKMVFFSYPIQAFAAYENGNLVRWGPTSMGSKAHPTKTGLSFSNWKSEEHVSTADDEWILKWNFNIRNKEGIGWHEYTMPGYPASHSCLRLLENDAKWLYDWADQWVVEKDQHILAEGTPVIVFGSYDFEGKKPWFNLLENPAGNNISEEALTNELSPNMEKIMQEQQKRKEQENSAADSLAT